MLAECRCALTSRHHSAPHCVVLRRGFDDTPGLPLEARIHPKF
jgi:hypothetical protein